MEGTERRVNWRHALPLAGVICLCVGWPALLAHYTGSLGIPHNDAWAYSLIAQRYAHGGAFELVGWAAVGLAGQVVVLGPLGASIVIQHLFVAALASVGLLATYGWLIPRVGAGRALLSTALVGLMPDFGLLATSYMTDLPAYAAVVSCLFLTDHALRTRQTRYLLGALAVGTWGVTVRELAIVGPVVAVVVTAMAWRGRERWIALLGGVFSFLVIVGFEMWRRSLAYGEPPWFHVDPVYAATIAACGCFTVALAVFPAALLTARPGSWSRRARLMSALALLVAVVGACVLQGKVFLGNYLQRSGAYSDASIGVRSVFPNWWWFGLVAIACVSVALIVGCVIDAGVSLDPMFGLLLLLLVGGTFVQALTGHLIFARYVLLVVVIVCVALLGSPRVGERSRPSGPRRVLVLVAIAFLVATSTAITGNALAWDAARWQAASALVARGVPATDIDAGLEWVGYHASGPAAWSSAHTGALAFYMPAFAHSRECYAISASPLEGLRLDSTERYHTYGLVGSSTLWVYRLSPCR